MSTELSNSNSLWLIGSHVAVPMSEAQSGVPGPGEMTTLSYVPEDNSSDNANHVS